MTVSEGRYEIKTNKAPLSFDRLHQSSHVAKNLEMDSGNVIIDSDMDYPTLFIPKKCTPLHTNYKLSNTVIYVNVNITFIDREGNQASIYRGFCNIKLLDSNDANLNTEETPESSTEELGIDQMPAILSETNQLFSPNSQSEVWIDPSRSPFVYNHDPEDQYSICEPGELITVEQHNTRIPQNVYNCNKSNVFIFKESSQSPVKDSECKQYRNVQETGLMGHVDTNQSYYEENDSQSVLLSQLPEEIINEKQTGAKEEEVVQPENNALTQLMSSDIQSTSKQRKIIQFLGHDSRSGQTVQNIMYNDPLIKCAEMEVDNEVVKEVSSSNPKKKKYQCDKCKQIFKKISSFHQHRVGNHSNLELPHSIKKNLSCTCKDCGKYLKNENALKLHCLGHGDPDRECSKCRKVFASKFSLKVHMKIHNRKYLCAYCTKTYGIFEDLQTHMVKVHYLYMCNDENCTFVSGDATTLPNHKHSNENEVLDNNGIDDLIEEIDLMPEVGQDFRLGQESNDFSKSEDLSGSSEILELMSEGLTQPLENKKEAARIRKADLVIAKVMSNKTFLLSSTKSRKDGYRTTCRRTCNVCQKTFDRIDNLKRHLIEHMIKSTLAKTPVTLTGTLNITCEICKTETFNKVDKYKAHLREHAKLTKYNCTFCNKSFSDSSNFSKHKKIHGVAYLQCDICNRKFSSKKMFIQHKDVHTKTTPVKCSYCNMSFHLKSMLTRHIRYAHKKEECSKFRCIFCDEIFGSPKEKWNHQWNVHNFRKNIVDCSICGSQFRKYSELRRHCIDEHEMYISSARKLLKKQNSRKSSE